MLAGAPVSQHYFPSRRPRNHWSVAIAACGAAPPQTLTGAWDVTNVTLRAGARLRFADEQFDISLDGQMLTGGNRTFRFYAAARPTELAPTSGPASGIQLLRVSAENLGGADTYHCDFRLSDGTQSISTASVVRRHNDTDGAGGAGVVECFTPAAPALGDARVGLRVRRDGQMYSTHDESASVPLVYHVYPTLSSNAVHAPRSGPVDGGTLINISFDEPVVRGVWLTSPRCRFTDWCARAHGTLPAIDLVACVQGMRIVQCTFCHQCRALPASA